MILQKKAEQKSRQPQETWERCVLCGAETDIPRSARVDLRYGYVEGAGQLCRRCYQELYR